MAEKSSCVTQHRAYIFDRGGQRRIAPVVDLSKVTWDRGRDVVTEGMIRLEGDSCSRQAALLNRLRSKRHELVIYRGSSRVWEGPIFRIETGNGYGEIWARDVLSYLGGQPLTRVWDDPVEGTTATARLGEIITWEMTHGRTQGVFNGSEWVDTPVPAWESLDPPANVVPHLDIRHFPNEAGSAMKTIPFQMTVLEHLKNRARYGGIDYTALGRKIIIWDVSRSLGRTRMLTAADFLGAEPVVTEYGADHTQAAYTIGNDGAYGSALNPVNMDYYGPWTTMFTQYNEDSTREPTQAELNSQASRNTVGRSPVPIEVRIPDNSTIILSPTLTIDMLVPGVQMPLLATLNARPISQMQKLDHMTVTEDAAGENIQVMLTPATRADDDVEED